MLPRFILTVRYEADHSTGLALQMGKLRPRDARELVPVTELLGGAGRLFQLLKRWRGNLNTISREPRNVMGPGLRRVCFERQQRPGCCLFTQDLWQIIKCPFLQAHYCHLPEH